MEYSCPDPSCTLVLFPGLLYADKRAPGKSDKGECPAQGQKEPSLAVFGLHSSGAATLCPLPPARRTRVGTTNNKKPSSAGMQRERQEATLLPSIIGCKSFGLVSANNHNERSRNQEDHDSGAKPRRPAARGLHDRALPPIDRPQPPSGFGDTMMSQDERLNHAEQARTEQRKLEKERLRKQREQREERLRRAAQQGDQVAFGVGASLGGQLASASGTCNLEPLSQPKSRNLSTKTARRAPTSLPTDLTDLCIGRK